MGLYNHTAPQPPQFRLYMSKSTQLGTTPQRWTAATINFLTQDEMRRLLDAIDSKRDYAIFLLAYRHGLQSL